MLFHYNIKPKIVMSYKLLWSIFKFSNYGTFHFNAVSPNKYNHKCAASQRVKEYFVCMCVCEHWRIERRE